MEVMLAKLSTGEMIIGELKDDIIHKCLQLRPVPVAQNQIQIAMAPVFAGVSEEMVDINIDNCVVQTMNVPKEVSDKYVEFRSGLIISSKVPQPPQPKTPNNIRRM